MSFRSPFLGWSVFVFFDVFFAGSTIRSTDVLERRLDFRALETVVVDFVRIRPPGTAVIEEVREVFGVFDVRSTGTPPVATGGSEIFGVRPLGIPVTAGGSEIFGVFGVRFFGISLPKLRRVPR